MAKGTVTAKSLRAGQTVYCVNALGSESSIKKHVITSRPYKRRSIICGFVIGTKVNTVVMNPFSTDPMVMRERGFFLSDFNVSGVSGNPLAKHKAFYTLKAAERYLNQCIKYDINLVHQGDDFDLWSPMDDVEWDHSPAD